MALTEKIKFTKDFDPYAKHLIKKLCKQDLSERYGNLIGGIKDIKKHRFFESINYKSLE
jgi:protein kinase X